MNTNLSLSLLDDEAHFSISLWNEWEPVSPPEERGRYLSFKRRKLEPVSHYFIYVLFALIKLFIKEKLK